MSLDILITILLLKKYFIAKKLKIIEK